MVGDIVLIIVLYLSALAMIVLEICTPTFGLCTVISLGCLAAGIYFCFGISQVLGVVVTVVTVIAFPVFVIAAVKTIPRTWLGRRLVLTRQRAVPGEGTPEAGGLRELLGKEGVAETLLRPSGAVRIDGRRLPASAESSVIEKGSPVKVVRIVGSDIVVRKIAPPGQAGSS